SAGAQATVSVGIRSRLAATHTAPAAGTAASTGNMRRPKWNTSGIAIRAATAWAARIAITGGSFRVDARMPTCSCTPPWWGGGPEADREGLPRPLYRTFLIVRVQRR